MLNTLKREQVETAINLIVERLTKQFRHAYGLEEAIGVVVTISTIEDGFDMAEITNSIGSLSNDMSTTVAAYTVMANTVVEIEI